MGLLSGLGKLGLGNLEKSDLYEKEEPKAAKEKVEAPSEPEIREEDLIINREYTCPVCDKKFSSKMMKTGKVKLIGADFDMRPRYDGIDVNKYDAVVCTVCGYAALTRDFKTLLPKQREWIREQICPYVTISDYDGEIYTYEEAQERYQLALACAMVKKAKASEKANICRKTAWVLRGYQEYLAAEDAKNGDAANAMKIQELKSDENECLENAYRGFLEARQTEDLPIAGLDTISVDYLLAQLAFYNKDYDNAMKLSATILNSPSAKSQIKDKIRDLKDEIAAAKKAGK